jgi:hypothetical protein
VCLWKGGVGGGGEGGCALVEGGGGERGTPCSALPPCPAFVAIHASVAPLPLVLPLLLFSLGPPATGWLSFNVVAFPVTPCVPLWFWFDQLPKGELAKVREVSALLKNIQTMATSLLKTPAQLHAKGEKGALVRVCARARVANPLHANTPA